MSRETVLVDIHDERERQDAKWGVARQDHLKNGTGGEYRASARLYQKLCDLATARGHVTFSDILLEEVYEALAEEDPTALRKELIQVAAVCVKWVEKLDRVDLKPFEHRENCTVTLTGCSCTAGTVELATALPEEPE